jgi:Flp pilus assembly protein TadD
MVPRVAGRLNKRKAAAQLDQARLLAQGGAWDRVLTVVAPVLEAKLLPGTEAESLYAEGLERLGRKAEARAFLEKALATRRDEPNLTARLGILLVHANESARGVELMARVRHQLRREPTFLTNYAAGLLKVGRVEEAETALAAAMLTGGGDDTRLVFALAKAQKGDAPGAEAIAVQIGTQSKDAGLRATARAIEADCRLMQGDARGALERFRALDAEGQLEADHLPHAALAAQLAGDEALANAFIQRRGASASAEDRLLFAQVALSRNRPLDALAELDQAARAIGEKLPGYEYEATVARGRALRLLGRADEARAQIERAKTMPEAELKLLGARVWLELGHLGAEAGDFELADAAFARALELDPNEAEARLARQSSSRKTAWKTELKQSSEARLEAARSEAEAMKRRFLAREGELEQMRRELDRLKSLSADAEQRAKALEREAKKVKDEQALRLREELEARERDSDEKAREVVEQALGAAAPACPETLLRMVLVAERTYQKGLYSELPAAAVAVLFSGALERSLFMLLVQRFDEWLEKTGRRAAFLKGAVREKRGRRVEYFDRFVEAFDRTLEAKAPSLGEVSRALTRRRDGPLADFNAFLQAAGHDDAFLDALADFVQSAKERLRDPVAHGLAIDLSWDELKAFRKAFLLEFGKGPGVLAQLLGAR